MPDLPHGQDERGTLSAEKRELARIAFLSVVNAAVPAYELGQLHLFHDDDESYIRKEVERKLYEPQLPNGGPRERRIIQRLKVLARDKDLEVSRRAQYAITQWEKVLPRDPRNAGRYYTRKPMTPRADKQEYEWFTERVRQAQSDKQWERKWFLQMVLDGLPEPVSDFSMECLFLLRKSDGTVDRLVRLRNILGESSKGPEYKSSHKLDPEAFAAPEKYRRWCLAHGNFTWDGNQKDLAKLHYDNTHTNAWRVINRIDCVGSMKVGKSIIWFCDDCAYADDQMLTADEDGIYWWKGEGYYLNPRGRETDFSQGRPKMRPQKKIRDLIGELYPDQSEPETYRNYHAEVCDKLWDSVGSYEAWLAMGSLFSFSAAPEIFDEYGLFPGLWIHGQMASGKTKIVEWLMAFRGFHISAGISLQEGTVVGLQQEGENYSNEPIAVDEFFQGKVDKGREATIKDSFNRLSARKWSPDGVQRVMRTSFVVSGEGTSSDAAMRSRFPHIQIAKAKRVRNHLKWMEAQKQNFFIFGRLLLEHRSEFVRLLRANLDEWLHCPDIADINEREKMAHGIPWAAWEAVTQLIDSLVKAPGGIPVERRGEFLKFVIQHARGSSSDVLDETNVMVFLTDLLTAWKAGDVDLSCFRYDSELMDYPPGRPNQNQGWEKYRLYIDPEVTISAVGAWLTKQRRELSLRRKDLRDQLSKLPFWVEPPPGKKLRMRIGAAGGVTAVWGFDLDKMGELGYLACSDEEYDHYVQHRYHEDGETDPRKGPFYAIVAALKKKEKEDNK